MFRYLLLFLVLFGNTMAYAQTNVNDQLIVFTNKENPVLTNQDQADLEQLAKKAVIDIQFVDVSQGAPAEITYTPRIVFQNYLGRSYYYGRYKNLSRLQNFIRTSRLAHQRDTENIKENLLVWENQKATITAPLKITKLKGAVPSDYDEVAFEKEIKKAVANEMQDFKTATSFAYQRNTRSFYIDLHPYVDAKKNLVISAEIFSQYNCVKPVFQQFDPVLVSGKWKNRTKLFAEAGRKMEQVIQQQIRSSEIGDAFQPLSQNITIKDWEELNLSLPNKPVRQAIIQKNDDDLPTKWTIAPTENPNEPLVIFSFLPPVDSYAGEVKALSGTFDLGKNASLNNAKGTFEVQISDVTMGAEDFDYEVQNKMLQKVNFPASSFTFDRVEASNDPLIMGEVGELMAYGTFKLLGKTIPLEVPATVESFYNSKGEIRLQINASFQLPLYEQFKVEGPDGPSPAKDTLQFFMKFYLQPM